MLAVALHRQLLQVRGKALQVLLVREDGHRLGAEEIRVPHRQQPEEHRQVALERRGAEVLVHLVEAVQESAEALGTDGDHRRQTDRRVHGVAPAHPVPESEHVRGVDPELRYLRRVGGDGGEMLGHRLGVAAEPREEPPASAVGVGHRLQGREGLRRDDEERLRRIEVPGRLHQIGPVDVRHEAKRHRAVAVMLERFVGHHGPEVGAADTDVDDVADAFAGMPLPGAAAHAVGEIGHRVEHGVDVGHHVLAVDDDGRAAWGAQGDMQDGPVFRHVDLVSPEHRLDALPQAGLLGEPAEQGQGLVGDAILRVVGMDARRLRGQALTPRRVLGEERAEVRLPDLLLMGLERLPRLARSQWQRFRHGSSFSVSWPCRGWQGCHAPHRAGPHTTRASFVLS